MIPKKPAPPTPRKPTPPTKPLVAEQRLVKMVTGVGDGRKSHDILQRPTYKGLIKFGYYCDESGRQSSGIFFEFENKPRIYITFDELAETLSR